MFSGRFKPFSCSSMCYNVIRIIILISIIILIKKVQHNNDDNKSVLPSYLPAVLKSHLPSNRPSGLLPSSRDTVPLSFRLIETVRHLSYNPPPHRFTFPTKYRPTVAPIIPPSYRSNRQSSIGNFGRRRLYSFDHRTTNSPPIVEPRPHLTTVERLLIRS